MGAKYSKLILADRKFDDNCCFYNGLFFREYNEIRKSIFQVKLDQTFYQFRTHSAKKNPPTKKY